MAINVEEHTVTQSVLALQRPFDWKAMESFAEYGAWGSSGDTIPDCLDEFREIRESKQRIGIAADGHPAGSSGAGGIERSGHERTVNGCATATGKKGIVFSTEIAWFGGILNRDGPLVEIGPRSVLGDPAVGGRQ